MIGKFLRKLYRAGNYGRTILARVGTTEIGKNCLIGPGCEVGLWLPPRRSGIIVLGDDCQLVRGCILHPYRGRILLGKNVFVGPYSIFYGHGGIEIGNDVLISAHCQILSSNHTTPAPQRHIRWEPDILLPTKIGNDVWLGAGVTVLGGVTIGDGCVVGAGAVVTKDLPRYSIAVGVPARVIRQRSQI